MNAISYHRLPWMGAVAFRGADARRFLQAQLTADVAALDGGDAVAAGWCNPQGRVLAVLWLLAGEDRIVAILPRSMAPVVAAGLGRFVLRAKVVVTDESPRLAIAGLSRLEPDAGADWPRPPGLVSGRLPGARVLLAGPAGTLDAIGGRFAPASEASWNRLSASLGEPVVLPPTSGEWIPQMLNLDLVGAVSFTKGCYPGQEIVARTHHLGRARRRMARYHVISGPLPPCGQPLFVGSEKVAEVVTTAPGDPPELLAVVDLGQLGQALTDASGSLACVPRPLPYRLPDPREAGAG